MGEGEAAAHTVAIRYKQSEVKTMNQVEYKDIPITDLLLDVTNPRNPVAESQINEIHMMLEGKGAGEILTLGKSIAEEQNPLANVGAYYDKTSGKYIVLEGNRRLTALKLLHNPELAVKPGDKKAFQAIRDNVGRDNIPESLHCAVFTTREDAARWIILTHTGENDGEGTKRWGTNEQARFMHSQGRNPGRVFMTCEYLRKNPYFDWTVPSWKEGIRNPTTLERLLDDNAIFSMLKLRQAKDWTISSSDDEWSARLLHVLITRVDSGQLQARMINTRAEGREYVERLITEMFPSCHDAVGHDDPSWSEGSGSDGSPKKSSDSGYGVRSQSFGGGDDEESTKWNSREEEDGADEETSPRPTPSAPSLKTRKKFVKGQLGKLNGVSESKASQIYDEFKRIDCEALPVASQFLLRALIEETGRCFQNSGMIKKQLPERHQANMSMLMDSCIEYVKSAGNDKQRADASRIVVQKTDKKTVIPEMEHLNNGIHGMNIITDKSTLFIIWDLFQPFIQDLWDMMNAYNRKGKEKRK